MSLTNTVQNSLLPAQDQYIYSHRLQLALQEEFAPIENLIYNVTEFAHGETFRIPSMGQTSISDVAKGQDIPLQDINMGSITMTITERTGGGFPIYDDDVTDGILVTDVVNMALSDLKNQMVKDKVVKLLAAFNDAQTAGNPNNINGQPHRIKATGAGNTVTLADLRKAALSLDMANAPSAGRVLIMHPTALYTLTGLLTATTENSLGSASQTLLERGEHKGGVRYAMPLFGFEIYSSNEVPLIASGDNVDGSAVTTVDTYANIFACASDDNAKALAFAERQAPDLMMKYDESKRRTEYNSLTRWGKKVKRLDTFGIIAGV